MNFNKRGEKAFSLLEVLVAVAVFAAITSAAAGLLVSVQKSWRKQKSSVSLISNSRWAMEFLANEIRSSGNPQVLAGRLRVRPYPGPPAPYVWYWRGNTASDATGLGDRTFLYRGTGASIAAAYASRAQLANFIVDNPDLLNNATGAVGADGNTDPTFIVNGNLVIIELTLRPEPTLAVGTNNRDFTLNAKARVRN